MRFKGVNTGQNNPILSHQISPVSQPLKATGGTGFSQGNCMPHFSDHFWNLYHHDMYPHLYSVVLPHIIWIKNVKFLIGPGPGGTTSSKLPACGFDRDTFLHWCNAAAKANATRFLQTAAAAPVPLWRTHPPTHHSHTDMCVLQFLVLLSHMGQSFQTYERETLCSS